MEPTGPAAPSPSLSTSSSPPAANPIPSWVHAAPKVVLHDHLDGGLRPATVAALARAQGYSRLPTLDPETLAAWFAATSRQRDLVGYLAGFRHTVALTQSADALTQVAYEAVCDLAADGVLYAEVRFAPELHLEAGLDLDAVVAAVTRGLEAGEADTGCVSRSILCAMRSASYATDIARLAIKHRDRGVVGFDIAGAEAGNPPARHRAAFALCAEAQLPVTIHAGEAFGLPSIDEALHDCGAVRLGHGVRIVDDITTSATSIPLGGSHDEPVPDPTAESAPRLGLLARWVRDRRVPLEICPSSNLHTGVCDSLAQHPVGLLSQLRFRVTVNPDNRLMSATSMSGELAALVDTFDWGPEQCRWVTKNAAKSAFCDLDLRAEVLARVEAGYDALAT